MFLALGIQYGNVMAICSEVIALIKVSVLLRRRLSFRLLTLGFQPKRGCRSYGRHLVSSLVGTKRARNLRRRAQALIHNSYFRCLVDFFVISPSIHESLNKSEMNESKRLVPRYNPRLPKISLLVTSIARDPHLVTLPAARLTICSQPQFRLFHWKGNRPKSLNQ